MVPFYVYPLKFILTYVVSKVMGMPQPAVTLRDGRVEAVLEAWQAPQLMIIFGAGFVAVSLVFVLMYWHAWRQRDRLGLNDLEQLDTRESIGGATVNIVVGSLSMLFAWIRMTGM